jgi:hypothetical protein
VVENSKYTFTYMEKAEFLSQVIEALDGLTKRGVESYEFFIELNPLARQVILASRKLNRQHSRIFASFGVDDGEEGKFSFSWAIYKF